MESKRNTNIVKSTPFWAIISVIIILAGCANQQPPGGGDEDKIPPKVTISAPKPKTLNYDGNSITYSFNEYVDRRSFQDAFRISPQIKGEVEFNWSGKEVEVVFPKTFRSIDANKTFVATVNTALKDIHGNSITTPVAFAFATGNKIDEASVAGKIFNNSRKNVSVFAYKLDAAESNYDPSKNVADYSTETSPEGDYMLTNMAKGIYRIIAIDDDDKNYLYTSERESFAVLPSDMTLEENLSLKGINFFMKQTGGKDTIPELNIEKYFKDSLFIVYSSVKNGAENVLPEQSIFLFFNRFKPSRESFVNNMQVKDENGTAEKMVFNWRNDSLVEVFASNKFGAAKAYTISFNVNTDKDTVYHYNLKFRVVSNNSYGEIKGRVMFLATDSSSKMIEYTQIKLNLESKEIIPPLRYSFDITDSVFTFNKILEADYNIFAFIDSKGTGVYYYGNPLPFEYSEPFYFYPQTLSVKGGWSVENIQIIFTK